MKCKNLWARCTKITAKEKSAVHWSKYFPSISIPSGKKLAEKRKASQEIQPLLPTLPMMWLGNSCSLSEPSFLHLLQNRKCCPTNLIQETEKNQLFMSVGYHINAMHYCKDSHAVFSLFKLQRTPLFLLLLLFPRSSGSAITCAFSKHQCWNDRQQEAGGRPPQTWYEAQAPTCPQWLKLHCLPCSGCQRQCNADWGALDPSLLFSLPQDLCHHVQSLDFSMGRFPAKQYLLSCTMVKSVAKSSCMQNTSQNFVTCCNITEQGLKPAYSLSHLGTDDMGKSKMENCVSAGFPL